jgi:hypothetical protein
MLAKGGACAAGGAEGEGQGPLPAGTRGRAWGAADHREEEGQGPRQRGDTARTPPRQGRARDVAPGKGGMTLQRWVEEECAAAISD